jgi:hypothetical protein
MMAEKDQVDWQPTAFETSKQKTPPPEGDGVLFDRDT